MSRMPIPFDEQFWRDAGVQFKSLYDLARHPIDDGFFIWTGRTSYDLYVTGLTPAASLKKHLAECRVALGLDPAPKKDEEPPQTGPIIKPAVTPGSTGHVEAGPATEARARQILEATFQAFPQLHAVFSTEDEAVNAAEQLLRRTIWHLQRAGFQAGRQRNPSGLISKDKFTIQLSDQPGVWRWVDVFTLGFANQATRVSWSEPKAEGAQHVPDTGIADP